MSRYSPSISRNNELNAQTDFGATGDGTTDDTTSLQNAINAAVSQKRPLYIPDPVVAYKVTGPIDMYKSGLRAYGKSRETTVIRSTAINVPVVKVGGRNQYVADLRFEYDSQRPSTATAANCIELHKPYWSTYERLWSRLGARGVAIAQQDVVLEEVLTGNTAFSSTFNDIRVHGYTIDGINLNSYGGGGTGCVWNNTYISNNPTGTKQTPTGYALYINEYDEMVFNQLNIEWGTHTNDVMLFETTGAIVINGLHIEQVDLASAAFAYIAISDDVRLLIDGASLVWSTLATASTRYFIRAIGDAHANVRGMRHHNNTNQGTFIFLNAGNATAGTSTVRASGIMPGLFNLEVANEKAYPNQILQEYNKTSAIDDKGGQVHNVRSYPTPQDALNAAQESGLPLYFPAGTFDIQNLTATKKVTIIGAGKRQTILRLPTGVSATTDGIVFNPDVGEQVGWTLRGLCIESQTTGQGRDALRIIMQAGRSMARLLVEDCWFRGTGGWSVMLDNGTSAAPNGSWTTATFRSCQFNAGMSLVAAYDSLTIEDVVLPASTSLGTNGLLIDMVAGAANLRLIGCNITSPAGVTINGAVAPKLIGNYIEAVPGGTYALANNALVDLNASSRELVGAQIHYNVIADWSTAGGLECLRINDCDETDIDHNSFATTGTTPAIRITAAATDTIVGRGNKQRGASTTFLADAGVRTTRRPIRSPIASSLIADSAAITNTAVETRYNKVLTIPGGTLAVGDVIRFRFSGLWSTDAAGTVAITHRVYLGATGAGVQVAANGVTHGAGVTNNDWDIRGEFVVRSIGPTGTVKPISPLLAIEGNTGAILMAGVTATTITLDTTLDRTIEVSIQPAAARVGDSLKVTGATLEIISPDMVVS